MTTAAVPAVEVDAPAPATEAVVDSPLADDTPAETPATQESAPAETPTPDAVKEGDDLAPSPLADDADEVPVEKADGQTDAKEGAESEYEAAFADLPDGMELDKAAADQALVLFKENDIKPDVAKKLVSFYANATKTAHESLLAEQRSGHRQVVSEWLAESKAHPEFGGAKFQESCKRAVQAMNTLGSPELKSLLTEYGFDRHPQMLGFLARVGEKLLPDSLVKGDSTAPNGAARMPWEKMYPDMNPKD